MSETSRHGLAPREQSGGASTTTDRNCTLVKPREFNAPFTHMLNRACEGIIATWRSLGLSETEAQEQADNFRRRCLTLQGGGLMSEAELDATLEAVSSAMAAT